MASEFTTEQRREIAGRARTVHERVRGPPNDPGSEPPIEPEELLADWREQFPDAGAFRSRLAQSDLSADAVREQLTATRWPSDEPLPGWIDTLEALAGYLRSHAPDEVEATPDDLPFEDFLSTVAAFARERVPEGVAPSGTLSPMVEWLVRRLHFLCLRPLYVEFKSYVEYEEPALVEADPAEFDDLPRTYYVEFVDRMHEFGFANLCEEYPVLARQLTILVELWTDAVTECCRRLEADRDALRDRFDVSGAVTAFEPLSDDAHGEGRIPIRISFETGAVVYKPRDVGGGVALYAVLDALDDHLSTPPFRIPTYLSRDGYGWMERIGYADLPDEAAVTDYYRRAGALAAVAYVLHLTDCQHENLLVDGTGPTIVDGETAFHHQISPEAVPTPSEISAFAHDTVLSTLLAPWSVGDSLNRHADDLGVSHAGLGSSSEERPRHITQPEVEAANTDVVTVVESHPSIDPSTNTPSVEGADRPPADYLEPLTDGFTEAYETIHDLHDRGEFLEAIVQPELLEDVRNRLVYRATAQYASVLHTSAGRDPLRDGARLTVEFERLAVPFFDGRIEDEQYLAVYEAERRALRRRDVPRFTSRPTDTTVYHDGEPLDVAVASSGYEQCRRRLEEMSARDRDRQRWLLQYAFRPAVSETPPPAAGSADRFEATASELFEAALDEAIEVEDEDRWVSISPTESGIDLYPTDFSLYHGRGGVALTAAALAAVTGRDRYRDVAVETLQPILENIQQGGPPPNHGGTLGLGSVVYVLSAVADLLDADEYATAARTATAVVEDAAIEREQTYDVMEGTAGTLLGLLAYYDRFGNARVLDRAVTCGEGLLDGRVEVDGYRTWKTAPDKPPLTGFSHGASGIAYALARLADRSGESRFADAAREALQFESTLYDADRTNWAKSPRDEEYVDKWCHGRTGIGLARLRVGELLGDPELRSDGEDALAATAAAPPSTMDHLCCGNFGRAEAVLVGARRGDLDRRDAVELASRCLERRERDGALSMTGHSAAHANPVFFHGLSGVAYELLRLCEPEVVPSVLLLE